MELLDDIIVDIDLIVENKKRRNTHTAELFEPGAVAMGVRGPRSENPPVSSGN